MQHSETATHFPLTALRDELHRRRLTGFLVPRADEFQGEYVPPHSQRLHWLTGFGGSAGMAVVLADQAAIFVDGRYTIQVRQQVDVDLFQPQHVTEQPMSKWLAERLGSGDRLGFDPWLHTADQVKSLRLICDRVGADLVPCDSNPLDHVWQGRPTPPASPLEIQSAAHAGRSAADKRYEIAAILAEERLQAAVLTDPPSTAWLLNIRAQDVPHLPVPLCFAIIHADQSLDLFVQAQRVSPELAAHLGDAVRVRPPGEFVAALQELGQIGGRVRVDPAQAAWAIRHALKQAGAKVDYGPDPCALPKCSKNPVELQGARAAHRRDGVAMARFLAWLSRQDQVDELGAAERLEHFRRDNDLFRGLSFATIAGAGENGAIVHYQSTPTSNRRLETGELFLVDSGGQYLDGTTDVTRTMVCGNPSLDQCLHYTLVLQGHMALAQAIFPLGTTGPQLDMLARAPLWRQGLDYDHGTGHGVGSYLSVHEGPARISKLGTGAVALRPGMILSNEPGYYRSGAYGIRLENLVAVQELGIPNGGDRMLLGFETLTLVPFDRRLIRSDMLSDQDVAWLDGYHQRVLDIIGPDLDVADRDWLAWACGPIRR